MVGMRIECMTGARIQHRDELRGLRRAGDQMQTLGVQREHETHGYERAHRKQRQQPIDDPVQGSARHTRAV